MKAAREESIYKAFRISIMLTVAMCLSGIFLGISLRTRDLINEELLAHARAHVATVVLVRKWNSSYGGVYVEKKSGVNSNPYIKDPDLKAADGRTFTIRNPAMMTREISELSSWNADYTYHLSSLKPVNPSNAPDEGERKALVEFQGGAREKFWEERINGAPNLRYMAPLFVERPCLSCHASQGYKLGDVRGAITVNLPIGPIQSKLAKNTVQVVVFALLTTGFLLSLIWYFTRKLINQITIERETIQRMATIDALTGILNRRAVLEQFESEALRERRNLHGLSVALFDIDFFKRVNDSYGHQAGDEVLASVAKRAASVLRPYDTIGRYGGEEFLVLLPETNAETGLSVAERIRKVIEDEPFTAKSIKVTLSVGVTGFLAADEEDAVALMLGRADAALYEAKAAGRNRTVWAGAKKI